ncbi:MAG: O-antigen ligase family protein [Alphaproteobacteria bacterium]|nr:O-antigen ligase family protein [Alphaproteobacteria bacterium]
MFAQARDLLKRKRDWVFIATLLLLACSLAFGGASRLHAAPLAAVQLAALPVLILGLLRLNDDDGFTRHRTVLLLLLAALALPLLQLVPLPPGVWAGLPGRDVAGVAFEVTGGSPGWMPLSLAPDATWGAFLALLPPIAMVVATISGTSGQRRATAALYVGAACLYIFIGCVQFATKSPAVYPYPTTAPGTVSGLFANRNHLATFLLMAMPMAAVVGSIFQRSARSPARLGLWIFAAYCGIVVMALAIIRSRTGLVVMVPTLMASLWLAVQSGPRLQRKHVIAALGFAAAVALVTALGLEPLLSRFSGEAVGSEGRFAVWPIIANAASLYQPFGSGLGSFDAVYRSVEPLRLVDPTFLNQAHNDFLEIWLEAGVLGVGLVLVAMGWAGRLAISAWRSGSRHSDRRLAQAASLAILVLAVHSVVDYPVRTETIAVMLAFCVGLLSSWNARRVAAAAQSPT